MEERYLTLNEVSRYLNIPKSTLYKLTQKNEIPCVKIGKQLRFKKSSLDRWYAHKENVHAPTISSSKPKCILLIDDDPLVLSSVAKFLRTQGFVVELAQSGEEALEKVKASTFDLVITDVRMPGINGIETIKRIREFHQQHNRPRIPEIIISGYVDPQAQNQAEELGITDYVFKPFATTDFIKTIEKNLISLN